MYMSKNGVYTRMGGNGVSDVTIVTIITSVKEVSVVGRVSGIIRIAEYACPAHTFRMI